MTKSKLKKQHGNYMKLWILLSLFFISHIPVYATEIRPFTKASFKQIQQEHKNKPYIIAFWSETCDFCMKELVLFGRLMKIYPAVSLISITTNPYLEEETVNKILSTSHIENAEKWIFSDDFVERLYFSVNPRWRGELPLTYFFDKNNKMLKYLGVIKEKELISWLAKQQIFSTQ